MRKGKFNLIKIIKTCWKDISFRDKGLIIIMVILLIQCVHNLYNPTHQIQDYVSINVIIRTSVAGIFGYFLSSSFLYKSDSENDETATQEKLDLLDNMLENPEILEKINTEYKCINIKRVQKEEKHQEEIFICNRTLQDAVAIIMCIFILLTLMIGVNFNLIPPGATATLSQFRDLLSGCIGFLLGNRSIKKNDSLLK